MDPRTISYQVDRDGRRYFTNADMAKMVADGLIDPDDRWELLRGEWFDMPSEGWPHMIVRTKLNQLFSSMIGWPSDWLVNSEGSILPFHDTEVRPDMVVFRADARGNEMTGADIALVAEIMVSSHRRDRELKRPIYAAMGVPELWLIDLDRAVIEIHRTPTDGAFAERLEMSATDRISPSAFPQISVALDDLR